LKVQRILKLLEGRPKRRGSAQEQGNPVRHQHARRPVAARGEIKSAPPPFTPATPIATTLSGAKAAALGIAALKKGVYAVKNGAGISLKNRGSNENRSCPVAAAEAILRFHFVPPVAEEIIRDSLAGKDTFALLPTGGGKSLCFQLPHSCAMDSRLSSHR